ncbi:hypothetical protein LEP1GSC038_4111 [Leptospira weilii str. 2006001855]|uniref:Uncharacterized protein n=1 Tax=Leptospira weilii str. 2006001855 TaxID=996804 RepID=M6FJQ2_9LEPT|nr:hypothetical protein LEP1GSC051_2163 [Leptospira sp. P2653]EMM71377.1 hypothetical protein LEP1GSC038_4111 [Leptospira weilii str. 2006001855]
MEKEILDLNSSELKCFSLLLVVKALSIFFFLLSFGPFFLNGYS